MTESSEEEDVIGTSVGVAGRGEREKMSNEVLALLWQLMSEGERECESDRERKRWLWDE